jgi:hypothetical protein
VPWPLFTGEKLSRVPELHSWHCLLLEKELDAMNSPKQVSTTTMTGNCRAMGSRASLASMVAVAHRAGCPGMGPTQTGVALRPGSLGEVGGARYSTRWHNDDLGAPTRASQASSVVKEN